ncbi:hypothetical protein A4G26_28100 [Mycobacterium kansasii]|nr:hypothetical protein A4G26_28100 [Mycobacterium kansasii]
MPQQHQRSSAEAFNCCASRQQRHVEFYRIGIAEEISPSRRMSNELTCNYAAVFQPTIRLALFAD